MYMGIIGDPIGQVRTIIQALISVLLFLDSIVYFLITWIYQIILLLCQSDILGNSVDIDALVQRVYTIIGVVVLFLVAYSLLRSMVNPDETKGKKSPVNVIKNVLISVALIALTPTIFNFAYQFQAGILRENTIGKLILGESTTSLKDSEGNPTSSSETIADGGNLIASTLLQAFLHPNFELCDLNDDGTYSCDLTINTSGYNILFWSIPNIFTSTTFNELWEEISNGNFLLLPVFAYTLANENNMVYYYVISTAVGVFAFIVLLSYCIDVAIRTVKLAVFELFAPVPILARIMPGDQGEKVFNNWVKACLSTYVEVFIRLAILFFSILIIKIVLRNLPDIFIGSSLVEGEVGFRVFLFAQAFIIIGILLFIKQAPQIIKDITGLDGGKYKLFGGLKEAFGLAKTGVAFVGGSIAGGNPLAGFRAAKETNKSGNLQSIGAQYRRRQAKINAKEYGATFSDRAVDRVRQTMGMPSIKDTYEDMLKRNIDPITGQEFTATNQSRLSINLPNGTVINAGQTVQLNTETTQMLNEQKAINDERKADISEVVRQYQAANDSNRQYVGYEDEMKKIAAKEIKKGNFLVRDSDKKSLLDLTYVTQDGRTVSSLAAGMKTQQELEGWLERAKTDMSAEDYGRLSRQLQTAVSKFSVDAFIENNGKEEVLGKEENVELLRQKEAMATSLINNGGLLEIDSRTGMVTKFASDAGLSQQIDDLILALNNGTKKYSELTRNEISMLSDLGNKTLNNQISHAIQLQNLQKAELDEKNAAIDNMFDQGKKAAETFRTSNVYQAAQASSDAAHEEQAGKK